MKKLILLSILVGTGWLLTASNASAPPDKNANGLPDESSNLNDVVGKKCTVFLKTGEGTFGTLWEIGPDFLVLKIKKGPLYSKEEKYGFSEVKYVEDPDGKRIELPTASNSKRRPARPTKSVTPDNSVNRSRNPSSTYENDLRGLQEALKTLSQNEPQTSSTRSKDNSNFAVASDAKSKKADTDWQKSASTRRTTRRSPERTFSSQTNISNRTPRPEEAEPGLLIVSRKKKPVEEKTVSQPVRQDPPVQEDVLSEASEEPVDNKLQPPQDLQPDNQARQEAMTTNLTAALLRKQLYVLYAVCFVILILALMMKLKNVSENKFDKGTVFNAVLLKLQGQYGVVDQGSEDGIKVGDVVKFRTKANAKSSYSGYGRVVEIRDFHSAVQLIQMEQAKSPKAKQAVKKNKKSRQVKVKASRSSGFVLDKLNLATRNAADVQVIEDNFDPRVGSTPSGPGRRTRSQTTTDQHSDRFPNLLGPDAEPSYEDARNTDRDDATVADFQRFENQNRPVRQTTAVQDDWYRVNAERRGRIYEPDDRSPQALARPAEQKMSQRKENKVPPGVDPGQRRPHFSAPETSSEQRATSDDDTGLKLRIFADVLEPSDAQPTRPQSADHSTQSGQQTTRGQEPHTPVRVVQDPFQRRSREAYLQRQLNEMRKRQDPDPGQRDTGSEGSILRGFGLEEE